MSRSRRTPDRLIQVGIGGRANAGVVAVEHGCTPDHDPHQQNNERFHSLVSFGKRDTSPATPYMCVQEIAGETSRDIT